MAEMPTTKKSPVRLHHDPEALRWARLAKGWKQQELARELGILPTTLCQMEAGTRSAGPRLLPKVAAILGCPISILEAKRNPSKHAAALRALADLVELYPDLVTCGTYLRAVADPPELENPEFPLPGNEAA
ncbi:helix-turn-helix domain-containing protein [Kutzneria chonburiensis]|uniref:Helix-turn-helix domain-containing protein n=1 Tax=Kutzneria chonburiensis TaxID=1483604 RepID=A0ABV6N2S8_9PSEU|nr:helix-turn-helix transcriptional regulator [Kutzneria chonburiensis]